jgi:signal transduction histidine kinase
VTGNLPFRAAAILAALVTVAFVAWMLLELGGPRTTVAVDDLSQGLAALGAGVACLVAARRDASRYGRAWTQRLRRAWRLLAAAAFCWAAGQGVWSYMELVQGGQVPFPSAADIGYLAAVPLLVAAVLAFPSTPARMTARLRSLLDALIIGASLLAVSWVTVLGPMWDAGGPSLSARAVGLAYPVADIVIATIAFSLLTRTRGRDPVSTTLLATALLCLAVADSGFLYLAGDGTSQPGNLIDLGWLLGWLLIMVMAARPIEAQVPIREERVSLARLTLPYALLTLAFLTCVTVQLTAHQLGAFLFVNGIVLVVLVIVRQLVTLVENRGLNRRLERMVQELSEREAQLEKALSREQTAAERLRAVDAMKDTFLRAVSHDLRNPLTAILGVALTLERTKMELPRDKGMELLGMLVDKAHKLDRLLTDLLDLNRLEHALLEPNRSRTDVGALVRQVVREVDQLQGWPVSVEVDDLTADVDGPKLERIVENLLVNTVRHTPAGTPVWIRAAAVGPDLELVVEDAGPGVPPELAGTIFEPFRQGPSANDHSPGVGIGLSLVARFAQLHGGRAWVGERPGGGAAFHVLLPNAVLRPVPSPRPAQQPTAQVGPTVPMESALKVLDRAQGA